RHTRCLSDWSSDVCSSDLTSDGLKYTGPATGNCSVSPTTGLPCPSDRPMRVCASTSDPDGNSCTWINCGWLSNTPNEYFGGCAKIGRASCRERVKSWVVGE